MRGKGGGFDIFDGISVFGKNVHGIGTVLVSFSHGVTVLVLFSRRHFGIQRYCRCGDSIPDIFTLGECSKISSLSIYL